MFVENCISSGPTPRKKCGYWVAPSGSLTQSFTPLSIQKGKMKYYCLSTKNITCAKTSQRNVILLCKPVKTEVLLIFFFFLFFFFGGGGGAGERLIFCWTNEKQFIF